MRLPWEKNNRRTLKIPFTFLLKLYRQADFVEYLLTFVAITNRHAKKSNPKNQKSIGNKWTPFYGLINPKLNSLRFIIFYDDKIKWNLIHISWHIQFITNLVSYAFCTPLNSSRLPETIQNCQTDSSILR